MIKPRYTILISLLLVFCTTAILNAEGISGLKVSYDQKEDILTVDAKDVPLTRVLSEIAVKSGIEIMIDPSVEKDITLYLPAQPLEKALKQLARGLNYAMHYDKANSRLVAIKIVPQGKQTSSQVVSVTAPNKRDGHPNDRSSANYNATNNDGKEHISESQMGDQKEILNREKPDAMGMTSALPQVPKTRAEVPSADIEQ